MKKYISQPAFLNFIIVLILFISFLLEFFPIINSDDDFYFLYTLAGGYGNNPTHLTHFIYGWNPLLTWPIAKLFEINPNVNWYTSFLLLIHFLSCINLLQLFSEKLKLKLGVIVFIVFFLFIESRLLLSLNYSNASFISAISGCCSFLNYHDQKRKLISTSRIQFILSVSLIFISSLLRVHACVLFLILILWIGIFVLSFKNYKPFILHIFLIIIFIFISLEGHKVYNQAIIANWNKEESIRQDFFYVANHPSNDAVPKSIENSFIKNYFIFDSSYTNSSKIHHYSRSSVSNRLLSTKNNKEVFYWMFIELRVYLLLLVCIGITLFASSGLKNVVKWLLMSSLSISIFIFLMLYMKVTEGIFLTLLSSMIISSIYCFTTTTKSIHLNIVSSILLFLSCLWMIIRLIKLNESNIKKAEITKCNLLEIDAHRDLLFISSDNSFHDNGFPIWASPIQFPLLNMINKELILTNSYHHILKRYHINNLLKELPFSKNVVLFGENGPLLKEYYFSKQKIHIEKIKVEGFGCLKVFQIKCILIIP